MHRFARLAAVGLALAARAAAAAPEGPLELRTPGTLRDLFLDVVLWDARAVALPRLVLSWSVANDWSTPTTLTRGGRAVLVQLDEQADSLDVSLRVPWSALAGAGEGSWTRRVATALELRATAHWGGYTDGLVEAWHRLGHYTNFSRERYAHDQIHVGLLELGGARLFEVTSPVVSAGDVVVRNQVLLWQGGEPLRAGQPARAGVSLRLDFNVPAGRLATLGGSQGFDVGLGASASVEATSWLAVHALAAVSYWSGFPSSFPLQPARWHGSFDLSLAFVLGDVAILLEDRLATQAFQSGWALADAGPGGTVQSSASYALFRPQNQVALGVRAGPVSFWLMEDFTLGSNPGNGTGDWFYDTNAPDVAVGLSLAWPP